MAEKVETEGRNQDWLKWIAVAALIMAGVYLNSIFLRVFGTQGNRFGRYSWFCWMDCVSNCQRQRRFNRSLFGGSS